MDICDTKINDAISCEQAEANNCFIAAARSAVPELLDALEAKDAEIESLKGLREATIKALSDGAVQNAALRARCERLEKVREAAAELLRISTIKLSSMYQLPAEFRRLRGALDRAGEP